MPAYKDKAKGTWYASFYYEDWTGKKVKKMKRGFPTKREALEWERTFLQQQTADLEMTFENFVAVYVADMKGRIKENTWGTKEHILYKKLVPYFGKRKMCDIHSKEVIAWQNEMLGYRDKNGKPYSPVYLKTLHNQLSAVFNHAVRHYNLKVNPAAQAGNMGKPKGREMLFWTKAEYLKFAEAMMDKPLSYYAFEMLYWCGVREGELLALTPGDFDFEKQTVTISKSYQRIKGKDVITDPKTPKSNRVIQMPAFLCEEMRDYPARSPPHGTRWALTPPCAGPHLRSAPFRVSFGEQGWFPGNPPRTHEVSLRPPYADNFCSAFHMAVYFPPFASNSS